MGVSVLSKSLFRACSLQETPAACFFFSELPGCGGIVLVFLHITKRPKVYRTDGFPHNYRPHWTMYTCTSFYKLSCNEMYG